jgi:hypothetical protein
MYQPDWKVSLQKLDELSSASLSSTNVNSVIYLLSRLSDDFEEVRLKSKSLLSTLSNIDFVVV